MAKTIVDEVMKFSIVVNGNEAQKELYDLEKSTRDLTASNKEYRAEKIKLESQNKKDSSEYKKLTSLITQNNKKLALGKARMKELREEIGVSSLTMRQLKTRVKELNLELYNMGAKSPGRNRLISELKEVNAQIDKLKIKSKSTSLSIGGIANGFNKYAALGASAIATLTGVVLSAQKLIDFNGKLSDSMANVRKTTGFTNEEVEDLTKNFGLFQTRTSRINLLKIAEEGGRIGIAKDEIADFVSVMDKAVVALSDSFPGGVEETASKLGKLKLLFKETKKQSVDKAYNAIGSAINDLGAEGVASEKNIANFATRVGSLPEALKPTIADALALGAAFEENGIQAEIAGRAYSILLNQAAEESEKFAEVMGLTNAEVKVLINDDPLEFLIKFAKGLKGMNAIDTANTLKYLGVQADGANKVLGALSNNTDRFIDLMNLSNKSMADGTSLVNEYNIKNNNFAAVLDKIGKKLRGAFASGVISDGLKSLVTGFGKLLGVVKDADKAFSDQTKQLAKNVQESNKLAASGQRLLSEYNSLRKEGVEPTTESKHRLEEITLQLKDRFGDSVIEINKETGALELNTAAVKEQILAKRLAADEASAALVSQFVGAKEEEERLRNQLNQDKNNLATRERLSKAAGFTPRSSSRRSTSSKANRSPEVQAEIEATNTLNSTQERLNAILLRQFDIRAKLRENNVDVDEATNLFNPIAKPTSTTPTGGGGGNSFTPVSDTDTGKTKNRKVLLDYTRETEDLRLALISDSFRKEIEIQKAAHARKIEDLQSQKTTGEDNSAAINAEINKQIELQQQVHNNKLGAIYEQGIADKYGSVQESYETQKAFRLAAHEAEYAALGNNEKAKEDLDKKFQTEELKRDEAHLNQLLDNLQELRDAGEFGSIDMSLLTPEQVASFEKIVEEVKLKIAEIIAAKAGLSGGGDTESEISAQKVLDEEAGSLDIFGFSASDWQLTFDHLDGTAEKILAVQTAVQGMANIWKAYSSQIQKLNQADYNKFAQLQDRKKAKLDSNLEKGFINERQYNEGVRAIEEETARKKAELEYKQAKAEKEQGIASAIINTSLAIMQAYAQLGPIGGTIAAVLIGTLGALQIATIAKTPLPAKGYEEGYYGTMPIRRQQDGKVYNASYGGNPSTQLVDSPKYFLAGEGGKDFPEMIIDGKAFKQFDPGFKDALYREIARVKGYESGYYSSETKAPSFDAENRTDESSQALMMVLGKTNELLTDLQENGIVALLARTTKNAKAMRDDIKDYEKLRNKNKR